jgi:hypothetical protein
MSKAMQTRSLHLEEFKSRRQSHRNQRRGLSLRISRDNKTAIELFVAGVGVWEARLQRLVGSLADGK